MTDHLSEKISDALKALTSGSPLCKGVEKLLNELGYVSEKTVDINSVSEFMECFKPDKPLTQKQCALFKELRNIDIVFQVTDEEICFENSLFPSSFESERVKSFLFIASELKQKIYSRAHLAEITRAVNRHFKMPGIVFFLHGSFLTLGAVHRRTNKRDTNRDVLEKVTLIKDIRIKEPHRAHIDILSELSLSGMIDSGVSSFDKLHTEWEQTLNIEALNKRFYSELFKWFEQAVKECKFPDDGAETGNKEQHIIRLITRLLFSWFLKEKGLVPEELFDNNFALLNVKDYSYNPTNYYRTILQNLFFATLNTEINKRTFGKINNGKNPSFNHYRYRNLMLDADALIEKLKLVPFVNGGLFDCLDDFSNISSNRRLVDCFTDDPIDREKLHLPAHLFFDGQSGLFTLFQRYKFTVEENTPLDQEVALDPELLGQVFENLLAAYNPETSESVRKETGSFYTPRQIVDYMVREVLVEALVVNSQPVDSDSEFWRKKLHYLLDYSYAMDDANGLFNEIERQSVISAISQIRVIDPAVGSGAFPMGILQTLTLALRRLDPHNILWEQVQKERAKSKAGEAFNTQIQSHRDEKLQEISTTFEKYRDSDFGRKLYLIQNCIYGVDIQPIACQIAKLRFFISLLINQETDSKANNFGIKPLPNLETRFVAADALRNLLKLTNQEEIQTTDVIKLKEDLWANRKRYFHASNHSTKLKIQEEDKQLRTELAKQLKQSGFQTDYAQNIMQWDPYNQNNFATWFDPKYMFGVSDGFDVVIGNPPYIPLQKEGGRAGNLYRDIGYETFERTGDIYQLFFELGCRLLRSDTGTMAFISSNSWLRAKYGQRLRRYFTSQHSPLVLVELGKGVFENAIVDTAILIVRNGNHQMSKCRTSSITQNADYCFPPSKQDWGTLNSDGDKPWVVLSSTERSIIEKMESIGSPLREWDVSINRGVVTGYDDAFIVDTPTRDRLISENPSSSDILKPMLRGRNIKRYRANWAGLWLISTFPSLNLNISDYPSIKQHLLSFGKERLEQASHKLPRGDRSRKRTHHAWFELQDTCAKDAQAKTEASDMYADFKQYSTDAGVRNPLTKRRVLERLKQDHKVISQHRQRPVLWSGIKLNK